MTNVDACSLVYVLVSPNSPLYTCRRPFLPTPPGVCDLLPFDCTPLHLTTWTCPPRSTVPSTMEELQWVSLHKAWTMLECLVLLCYFLYLTHDALDQQLCGFVSRSSQCIDPMQCECHDSWHSQKSDVFPTISRTTQCVRGSTSSCSCAGEGWPYGCVCAQ